jgi:gliding motility-associated-like protein
LVKPEQNVTYSVVIADKNGCSGTATVRIRVQEEFPVYAPNVFAPESNDANGIFQLYSSDRVKTIKMFQVFDRGGSLVYEQRNAAPNSSFGWDGMYRGRLAAPGVYVFHAVLEYCTGKEKTVKGEVTLVR